MKIFEIKSNVLFFLPIVIFLTLYLLFIFRDKTYKFLKIKILNFKNIKKFITELKIIKKVIFLKKKSFLYIFLLFFILSMLQGYSFYLAANKFGMDISIINCLFIYVTSILLTTLIYFNFIGVFEFTLALSANFISQDYFDMLLIGFSLRIFNIVAMFFWIFFFSTIIFFFKNKSKKFEI